MQFMKAIADATSSIKFPFTKNKSVVVSGGFEVLPRLTGKSFTETELIKQYSKSMYVFACVNKIGDKVASIPLWLQRVINSKGDTKEIMTHPLLDLLYKPNPFQTRSEFWKILIINLRCAGEAFVFKVRKGNRVVELWNLRPDIMTIVTDPQEYVKEYQLRHPDGKVTRFDPKDIIHFKMPDPMNPYSGISALFAAQTRVQTEGFATDFQRDFFLNSARPDAILKTADKIAPEERDRIARKFEKRHRGTNRTSKIAVLSGGMEYQVISPTQKEMDYIESMKVTRDDILIAFGVPKSVLGITEDVNRANAEAGMAVFLSETIKPTITEIVEKLNEEMTYDDFDDSLEVIFEDPSPINRELLLEEHTKLTEANVLLINEARIERGYPPIKGGWSTWRSIAEVASGGLPSSEKSIGGETQKDAYLKFTPKRKRTDFRGKHALYRKLVVREKIAKAIKLAFSEMIKEKAEEGQAKIRSLISEKNKDIYAGIALKSIDKSADNMKARVDEFFEKQKDRVIAKLAIKGKAFKRKLSVTATDIFNEEKEVKASISFLTPEILAIVERAAQDSLDTVAPAEEFVNDTRTIQAFVKARAEDFGKSVTATTLEKLSKTLAEGVEASEGISEMIKRVEEVYSEFPSYRSELIARTEATAANNAGFIEGWRQSDVVNAKEWITAGDSRVRDSHAELDGEIAPLDKSFSDGQFQPSEPNCRCVLGPAFIED